jgi:hypothetical protein
VNQTDVSKVLSALVTEIQDCLVIGYSVSIPGLLKAEPVVKAGRKKGTVIRNPFDMNAPERKLRADEPDKFAVKLSKSSALAAKFPSLKTKAGKDLHAELQPRAPQKRGKAA